MWDFCHIRPTGTGIFEINFYGQWDGEGEARPYFSTPDHICKTLEAAKEFAGKRAKFVNVIEVPPKLTWY